MRPRLTGIRVERKYDESDFIEFGVEEVNYVDLFRPKKNSDSILRFHTNKGVFLAVTTLEGIRASWGKYGFVSLDAVNVVNLENITYVVENALFIRAYFGDGSYTTVSRSKYELVKHLKRKSHPD
ncbi:hypothetical protein C4A75_03555 [Brevibacillus laterosporus]|uniref:LytTR family transcriptional regulator DNA-binding domain-containing protein n=1 Tax=Brevibacillus laterosporus TaxID=1465 RepID=UPI000CE51D39|nr:LytTR family transcriptional regulator DNA-binding domain-containing protein [Brevibacillus laterosporus]PPA87065.1 hypothetical protein C4A75_03555 [Brevibacillus laterosporus]